MARPPRAAEPAELKEAREQVIKKLIKYNAQLVKPEEAVKTVSDKANKIYEELKKDSYTDSHILYRLAEILLGERLPPMPASTSRNDKLKIYEVLVPIKNSNSHNYALNQPMMCITNGSIGNHLRIDGSLGNNLPRTDCRLPTEVEIAAFVTRQDADSFREHFEPLLAL